jgi:hypothetical protein
MDTKPKRNAIGIQVGGDNKPLEVMSAAIDRVLASPAESAVKIEAIKALAAAGTINASINNTHINVE